MNEGRESRLKEDVFASCQTGLEINRGVLRKSAIGRELGFLRHSQESRRQSCFRREVAVLADGPVLTFLAFQVLGGNDPAPVAKNVDQQSQSDH